MRRIAATPRPNWQAKVEEAGLTWHTGETPYWNETAFYEFASKEVDILEKATNELETMTLQAAQHIIENKLYSRLGIPEIAIPLIESSWEAEPPSLRSTPGSGDRPSPGRCRRQRRGRRRRGRE